MNLFLNPKFSNFEKYASMKNTGMMHDLKTGKVLIKLYQEISLYNGRIEAA
ncbi:hypothetical protein MNB_SV-10-1609 [hydrothermal vent metagenome]|uniref:Uncharacterized protein n=1 Tax=hydrothermal vent metagenome TaxID=652676 RepID=A0A1W1BG38_9ZZZZ